MLVSILQCSKHILSSQAVSAGKRGCNCNAAQCFYHLLDMNKYIYLYIATISLRVEGF